MKLSDAYEHLELHVIDLNKDLPEMLGKAIKAAGGSYSECRSWAERRRFVKIPSTALELVQKVFSLYDIDIVIMRRPTELFLDRTVPPASRAFQSGKEVMVSGKAGRLRMRAERDAIVPYLEKLLAFADAPQALELQRANELARREAAIQATQARLANERKARINAQGEEMLRVLTALLERVGGAGDDLQELVQRGAAAVEAVSTPRETDLPLNALEAFA